MKLKATPVRKGGIYPARHTALGEQSSMKTHGLAVISEIPEGPRAGERGDDGADMGAAMA